MLIKPIKTIDIMENNTKLYIVSFGDSRKYRLSFVEKEAADGLHHSDLSPLASIEKELNDYLATLFPDGNFAYFTSPRVTEVEWEHRDRYKDYPLLDADAVEEIKGVLAKEVRDMEANRVLNSDAPYSDVVGG